MTADIREQLEASLGGAYTIERELGGGGMSRVFVAEETSLRRRVVVKIVPEATGAGVSIDRFRREIALAARLQHPHIVPVLAAGESGGLPYFTMPFVEGESLRARLDRAGELPVSDAVRILREVATALAYAHEHGIVHRDIKPDNVLLSSGSAMVTDFGVAKAVESARLAAPPEGGGATLTAAGTSLGTPAYMSPEQASADPEIDHRADLYSFGALAYEMFTGRPPFTGRTAQHVVAAHIIEAPEPIARKRPGLPPGLATLVMRCLEKRPSDRPQSAGEVVRALDDIATGASGATRARWRPARGGKWIALAAVLVAVALSVLAARRAGWLARSSGDAGLRAIAVLPFQNTSGDTAYDYFAEGVSDQLRSDLTGVPGLAVKGGSSSRTFAGRGVNVQEAGRKLGAAAVVTGTMSFRAGRLHMTAELENVADGTDLWSRTYDARVADLGAVQDSVTRAIANELRVSIAGMASDSSATSRGTDNREAYDLYLRGLYVENRGRFEEALNLYRAAVKLDPAFGRAYAGLARTYTAVPQMGVGTADSAHSAIALARATAAKAVALVPRAAEGYAAQAVVEWLAGNFAAADRYAAQALAVAPNDPEGHAVRAITLGVLGRPEQALVENRLALSMDPLDPRKHTSEGYLDYNVGDYRGAVDESRRVFDFSPSPVQAVIAYQQMGVAYAFAGKPDSALAALTKAFESDSAVYGARLYLMYAYALVGRWADARAQRRIIEAQRDDNSPNYTQTLIHITFGQRDSALTAAERMAAAHEPLYTFTNVGCDPLFDPLKADPRFEALMRRDSVHVCPPRGRYPVALPPRG